MIFYDLTYKLNNCDITINYLNFQTLSSVENDKQESLNKQEIFSEIEMENASEPGKNKAQENNEAESEIKTKKKRVPRRVIHFSDGIVEEFSTDSEDEEEKRKSALIEEGKIKLDLSQISRVKAKSAFISPTSLIVH